MCVDARDAQDNPFPWRWCRNGDIPNSEGVPSINLRIVIEVLLYKGYVTSR